MRRSFGIITKKTEFISDTIASGTDSGVIDLKGGTLLGIITPAGISSITYTMQASDVVDGTYLTVKNPDTGVAYSGTVAASGWYPINAAVTVGLPFVKFIFNASETAKTFKYSYRSFE